MLYTEIVLQVMKWSDGSYLEDQDMWWLSGIHRRASAPCHAGTCPCLPRHYLLPACLSTSWPLAFLPLLLACVSCSAAPASLCLLHTRACDGVALGTLSLRHHDL